MPSPSSTHAVLQHERRPLQGSLVATHAVLDGNAQRPLWQRPSQQSAFVSQTSPPPRQYVKNVHRPPRHCPEQHWLEVLHVSPSSAHEAAPVHAPPTHALPQQSASAAQPAPNDRQ